MLKVKFNVKIRYLCKNVFRLRKKIIEYYCDN